MKVELKSNNETPVEPPVIESITVDTKGKEYSEPEKLIFTTEVPSYDKELPVVTIEMEDGKKIEIELYPQLAPNTVNNFISLINEGFYDGLSFHQIYSELLIAGGAPEVGGAGDPGYSIKSEFNNLSQTAGVLSMARSSYTESAGSQFLIADMDISETNTNYLNDFLFTAFGKVINGAENVRALSKTKIVNEQYGAPENPPKMKKVTVDTKGVEYPEPEKITKE
ncbi:peptidylprolyl isomerase [Clostridium sp. 'deep sea']|nr:peptidylprolyl isomerase [Clostridium sp. 'deep sea']